MIPKRRDSLALLGGGSTKCTCRNNVRSLPQLVFLLVLVSSSLVESAFTPSSQSRGQLTTKKTPRTPLNYVNPSRESAYNASEASSLQQFQQSTTTSSSNPMLEMKDDELNSLLDEAVFLFTEWKDLESTEELVQDLQLLIKDLSLAMMGEQDSSSSSSSAAGALSGSASTPSASTPEKKLQLGESKLVLLAKKLEEALQQVMEGKITQEEMEAIAEQYRLAKEGTLELDDDVVAEEEEEVQDTASTTDSTSPDPAVLQSFRARLEAIKERAPQPEARSGFRSRIKNGVKRLASKVTGRSNNGYSNSNGATSPFSYGPKKVYPKLLFTNNQKPDPIKVQGLLDQATALQDSARDPALQKEVEDLREEIGHVLYYAQQKDEIIPIGKAIVKQKQQETATTAPVLVNGRTAEQIAQEMDAALQLHMSVGDDHSKSVLDELAEEYKRATERTAITPSSKAVEPEEEEEEFTAPPGFVEVSAKVIIESLQERVADLQQAMSGHHEPTLGRSSIWEAVASGYTERTENGFRVTPGVGGNVNDDAPRTQQRKRNGRKSQFDENGAFVAQEADPTVNAPQEEEEDEFIDVVVLEETATSVDDTDTPSPVAEEPETEAEPPLSLKERKQQRQQPGRKKDQAIDANVVPDKALTLPLNNFLDWTKINMANTNDQEMKADVPLVVDSLDTLEAWAASLEAQSEAEEEEEAEEDVAQRMEENRLAAEKFLEEQTPRREFVQQRMKENQQAAEAQNFLQEQEPRRELVRQRMEDNRLAAMVEDFLKADLALAKEDTIKSEEEKIAKEQPSSEKETVATAESTFMDAAKDTVKLEEEKIAKVQPSDETETVPTAESTFMDAVAEAMEELNISFGNEVEEIAESEEDKAQRMEENRLAAQKFLAEQEPRREFVHQRMKENKLAADSQKFLQEQEPRRELVHQRMKENKLAADTQKVLQEQEQVAQRMEENRLAAQKFLEEQEPRRVFVQQRMKENQLAADNQRMKENQLADTQKFLQEQEPRRELVHERMKQNKLAEDNQKFLQEQEPRREIAHQRMEENKLAAAEVKLVQDSPVAVPEDVEQLDQEPVDPKVDSNADSLVESEKIDLQVQEALDAAETAIDFASTPAKPKKVRVSREKALNKMAGTAINLTMKGAFGIANRFFASTKLDKKPKEREATMDPTPPKSPPPPPFFANFLDTDREAVEAESEAPSHDQIEPVADTLPNDSKPPVVPVVFKQKEMPSKPEPLSVEAKQKAELTARGLLERRLSQPKPTKKEESDISPTAIESLETTPEVWKESPQFTLEEEESKEEVQSVKPDTFDPVGDVAVLDQQMEENGLAADARKFLQEQEPRREFVQQRMKDNQLAADSQKFLQEQEPRRQFADQRMKENQLAADAQKFLQEQEPRREFVHQRMEENKLATTVEEEAVATTESEETVVEEAEIPANTNQLSSANSRATDGTSAPQTPLRDLYQTPRDELPVITPMNDVGTRLRDIYGRPMHGQPQSYGQGPDEGFTPFGDITGSDATAAAGTMEDEADTDSDDDDEEPPFVGGGGSQSLNFLDIRNVWVQGGKKVSTASYSLFRSSERRVKDGRQSVSAASNSLFRSSERYFKEALGSLKKLWISSGLYHLAAALLRKPLRPGRPSSRHKFSVSSQVMDDMFRRRHGMVTATSLSSHPQSPVQQLFQGQAQQHDPSMKDRRMLQAATVAALVYPILLRVMDPSVFLATIFLPHCLMLVRNGNR